MGVENLGFSESPNYSRGETKLITAATKGLFHAKQFCPIHCGPGSWQYSGICVTRCPGTVLSYYDHTVLDPEVIWVWLNSSAI